MLLFALGDHHHGRVGLYFLYLLQRLQTCKARHHLVEENEIEGHGATLVDGVGSVAHCLYVVAFLL